MLQTGVGVFIGDRGDMLLEGLLVQSDVWPVPGGEDDRTVSAVATKGTIGADAIKGSVWSTVNTGDLEVGLGIILIYCLETSKSPLYMEVVRDRRDRERNFSQKIQVGQVCILGKCPDLLTGNDGASCDAFCKYYHGQSKGGDAQSTECGEILTSYSVPVGPKERVASPIPTFDRVLQDMK